MNRRASTAFFITASPRCRFDEMPASSSLSGKGSRDRQKILVAPLTAPIVLPRNFLRVAVVRPGSTTPEPRISASAP